METVNDKQEDVVEEQLQFYENDKNTQNNEEKPDTKAITVLYAGFWMRFWAYIVDLIVIGSLNRLLLYPVFTYFEIPYLSNGPFSLYALLTAATFYLYFILMTKAFGKTLGKMIFGLKVIEKNEKPLTWSVVIFRELIGRFISKTVLMVGYLIVGFHQKKQGWHDMIADTIVVLDR